ncbi:hypothetical protein ACQR53_20865 [Xanthomonas oryzae]|uniref:hypothetical protein n=1 Tax=Xanthomonas oryzae TaxID=347 RepID=UPI003D165491
MPIARFGLHEILDLIPSALIAEAAGLDAIGMGWTPSEVESPNSSRARELRPRKVES